MRESTYHREESTMRHLRVPHQRAKTHHEGAKEQVKEQVKRLVQVLIVEELSQR